MNASRAQGVLHNLFYLVSENLFKMGAGVLVGIWTARFLGPENFGKLSYCLSFGMIITPFFVMGQDEIIIKKLVQNPGGENASRILADAYHCRLLGGLLGLLLAVAMGIWAQSESMETRLGVLVYAAALVFRSVFVIDYYFYSIGNIKRPSLYRNLAVGLILLLKVGAILMDSGWMAFLALSALEILFYSVAYFAGLAGTGIHFMTLPPDRARIRAMLRECAPLVAISFFAMGIMKIDQILIPHMLGNTQLGIYSVSAKMVEMWNFVPLAIITLLFTPIVASAPRPQEFLEKCAHLMGLVFWISFAFYVGSFFACRPVMGALYGEKFDQSIHVFMYYGLNVFTFYFLFAATKVLMALGDTLALVTLNALAFGLIVGLNLFMIPRHGLVGASLATFSGPVLAIAVMALTSKNIRFCVSCYFRGIATSPAGVLVWIKERRSSL